MGRPNNALCKMRENEIFTFTLEELLENADIEYVVPVTPSTGKLPANLTELKEAR